MAGQTPKTPKYDQPRSDQFGNIYRGLLEALGEGSRPFYLGPLDSGAMGRSPRQLYLGVPNADVTPQANPAAARAYTRNAPYMEAFMSDPQTMMTEIMRLRDELSQKPGDTVNEYRLRVLQGALRDVFGMGEKDARATAATTPRSDASYFGMQTTGER